ncbi:MAG TPA: hypothetical protein VJX10_06260 [Pseudonocardiaceae bacterium]|nr:hypothetical protein [Pseudonocardiaceae bacterium]
MRARLTGLVAAVGAAVVLCAGCTGTSAPAGQVTSGPNGRSGAELDQIQSTLDSVSARVDADSAP